MISYSEISINTLITTRAGCSPFWRANTLYKKHTGPKPEKVETLKFGGQTHPQPIPLSGAARALFSHTASSLFKSVLVKGLFSVLINI